jgi:hypothetical protein
MKKLLVMAALAAFTGSAVMAQAPDKVKEKFKTDNPNAMNTVWKNDKDNQYRVTYSENKTERALVYDKDGNIVSTQMVVKDTSIPTGITEYYTKRSTNSKEYSPNYTVWQTTDKNGNVMYYSESNGKSTYFDKDGKLTTHQGMAEGENEKQNEKMPIDK